MIVEKHLAWYDFLWLCNKKVEASCQTHPLHHLGVTLPFDKNYAWWERQIILVVLLAALTVAAHELIYATGRIDKLGLARVEGVRCA